MNVTMGSPARYDLSVDQGSTLRFQATWTNPDGSPVNITGYRVLFQIRLEPGSTATLLSFDSAALTAGQTIAPLGPTGLIDITVSDEITAALVAGVRVWDLLVESPAGVRDKLIFGRAIIRSTVTR